MAQAAQQASSEAMHLGVVVVDHGSRKRDSNDQLVSAEVSVQVPL